MRGLKKVLFAVIIVAAVVGMGTGVYAEENKDFNYYEDKGEVTIYGYLGGAEDMVIPEKINDKPVTSVYLGDYWETVDNKVKSIYIPGSVTNFNLAGDYLALENINVSEDNSRYFSEEGILYDSENNSLSTCPAGKKGIVNIKEGTKIIEFRSFNNCNDITEINIPASVEEISWVNGEKITSINVASDNKKYTSIDGCLYNYDKTKLIIVPKGKTGVLDICEGTKIIDDGFSGCNGITGINIPGSVEEIAGIYGENITSINVASDNKKYTSIDGCLYNYEKTKLIAVPKGKTGVLDICEGTKIIEDSFSNCGITEINIPASVEEVQEIFGNNMSSINVASDNKNYTSEDGCLYNYAKTCLIRVPMGKQGKVNISEGTTRIEWGAFQSCDSISEIYIPASLEKLSNIYGSGTTSIDISADNKMYSSINGCVYNKDKTNLMYVPNAIKGRLVIPDGVTAIGEEALYSCKGIEEIVIPDSVNAIGERAFSRCSGITAINLPDNLTKLSAYVFEDCDKLTSITIPKGVTEIDKDAFEDSNIVNISVSPDNMAYCTSENMLFNKDRDRLVMVFPDSEGKVTIPDTVKCISTKAFEWGRNITELYIPDSVTQLEEKALSGLYHAEKIRLPEGLSAISDEMLYSCSSLKEISIPKSVTSIGKEAFAWCDALTKVVIPENVTYVGEYCFAGCESLQEVDILSKVITNVENNMFKYEYEENSNLVNVTVHSRQVYDLINNKDIIGNNVTLNLIEDIVPIFLSEENVTLFTLDKMNTKTVKATLTGITGKVIWKTSNKKVAVVKNGKITAVSKGITVITASVGENSCSIKVTVKNPQIQVVDGSEVINSTKVKKGRSVYYKLKVTPAGQKVSVVKDKAGDRVAKVVIKNNHLCIKGLRKGKRVVKLKCGKVIKKVTVTVK